MTPDLILYLLSWATFFSGYPMPEELPTVEFRPHGYFVMRMCNNFESLEHPCRVRAMYSDYDTGILYLNRAFNTEKITAHTKGIIVHEMIHYLQDLSGQYKGIDDWSLVKICNARVIRQREAYYAQDAYMDIVHSVKRLLPRRLAPCGEF